MTTNGYGTDLLSQMLDASSLRHRVIAQNIANVNTPGYKRLEVAFEEELGKLLGRGSAASGAMPTVHEGDGVERVDGNTVDIDREVGDLNKNGLLYQAAAQILASRFGSLRAAISGR